MTRVSKCKRNKCSGEIMLEAIIIFPFVVFILLMVIALFSLYYQHWHYNNIANEIAMRVAATYRYSDSQNDVDLLTGSISMDGYTDMARHRYLFSNGKMSTYAKTSASKIADKRKEAIFAGEDLKVNTNILLDSVGRRHVVVELSCKYNVPFRGLLDKYGFDKLTTCKITTTADCLDYINYLSSVDYVVSISDPQILVDAVNFLSELMG